MKKANRYAVSWYNRCLLHLFLFKTNGIFPYFSMALLCGRSTKCFISPIGDNKSVFQSL